MNIVKFYFDSNKNKIETKYSNNDNSIVQSSNDNYIYLYSSDDKFKSVDLKVRQPNGKLMPLIHMILGKDDEGNKCWQRKLPLSFVDFSMGTNTTMRMDISFSLYYYNDYNTLAYPTTVASQIIIKRAVAGDITTDGSYNGTDVQNLWMVLGSEKDELINIQNTTINDISIFEYDDESSHINLGYKYGKDKKKTLDVEIPTFKSIYDMHINSGEEKAYFNTTDGLKLVGESEIIYNLSDEQKTSTFNTTTNIPIVPGSGIIMDVKEDNTILEVKIDPEYTGIDAPIRNGDGEHSLIFNDIENNKATHKNSAVFGQGNVSTSDNQVVVGQYCGTFNSGSYFVVGSGSSVDNRKNVFEVSNSSTNVYNALNVIAQMSVAGNINVSGPLYGSSIIESVGASIYGDTLIQGDLNSQGITTMNIANADTLTANSLTVNSMLIGSSSSALDGISDNYDFSATEPFSYIAVSQVALANAMEDVVKLDRSSSSGIQVYGNKDGKYGTTITADSDKTPNTVAIRDANGNLNISTADGTNADAVINVNYASSKLQSKLTAGDYIDITDNTIKVDDTALGLDYFKIDKSEKQSRTAPISTANGKQENLLLQALSPAGTSIVARSATGISTFERVYTGGINSIIGDNAVSTLQIYNNALIDLTVDKTTTDTGTLSTSQLTLIQTYKRINVTYDNQVYYRMDPSNAPDGTLNYIHIDCVQDGNGGYRATGKCFSVTVSTRAWKVVDLNFGSSSSQFKTLFGDKSITGSGNIDIYDHNIIITKGTYTVYLSHYSSKNTVVDSLTDLKTIIGDTFTVSCTGSDSSGAKFPVALSQTSIIFNDGTTELLTNATFTDTLTTI